MMKKNYLTPNALLLSVPTDIITTSSSAEDDGFEDVNIAPGSWFL